MFNRYKILAAALAILGFSFLGGETEAGKPGKLSGLQGAVYAVDAAGGTVTLKDANGATTVLSVGRKSKLTRNRKKVPISGLVLGDQAGASFDGSNNVKQLSATGVAVSTVQGGVLGVSSGTGIVQLDGGGFGTDAHTRIVRNGRISSLGSLTAHDHAVAHVTGGGASPHAATADASEPDGDNNDTAVDVQVEGPEECEVQGTIAAIDLAANTVTITSEYGGDDLIVNVTADTLIEIENEGEGDGEAAAATIADLVVGQSVEVVYDSETLNAFRIEVQDEENEGYAEGPITAIDAAAGTITIDCYGAPVTLLVDASTKIEKNDEPVVFADLRIGDEVMAEYNSATMIARRIEVYTPDGD